MNPVFTVMNPNGMITAKSEEEITEDDHIIYDSDGSMYMNISSGAMDSGISISSDESDNIIIHNNVFYSTIDDPSGTPTTKYTDMKISEVDSDNGSWEQGAYTSSVSGSSALYIADGETWDPAGLSATTTVGETYRMSFDTATKYTDMFFGFTGFLILLLIVIAISKFLINTTKKTHKAEAEDVVIYKPGRLLRRLDA